MAVDWKMFGWASFDASLLAINVLGF